MEGVRGASLVEGIQPVVLTGGRSTRFGRDKLREPWGGSEGGSWLIDQPRLVLERVFGARVWAVGECHESVGARFSRVIADAGPGSGPLGGILTALRAASADVLVLAGDLPRIDAAAVGALLSTAASNPGADAVLGRTDRPQPCIAIYRKSAVGPLERAIGLGRFGPVASIEGLGVVFAPLAWGSAENVNRPEDLGGARDSR